MSQRILNNLDASVDFRTKLNDNFSELYTEAAAGSLAVDNFAFRTVKPLTSPTDGVSVPLEIPAQGLKATTGSLSNLRPTSTGKYVGSVTYQRIEGSSLLRTAKMVVVDPASDTTTLIADTLDSIVLNGGSSTNVYVRVDNDNNTAFLIYMTFPASVSLRKCYIVAYNYETDTKLYDLSLDIGSYNAALNSIYEVTYYDPTKQFIGCAGSYFYNVDLATGTVYEFPRDAGMTASPGQENREKSFELNRIDTDTVIMRSRYSCSKTGIKFAKLTYGADATTAPTVVYSTEVPLTTYYGEFPWWASMSNSWSYSSGGNSSVRLGLARKDGSKMYFVVMNELSHLATGATSACSVGLYELDVDTMAVTFVGPAMYDGRAGTSYQPAYNQNYDGTEFITWDAYGAHCAEITHPGMAFNCFGHDDLSDVEDRWYSNLTYTLDYGIGNNIVDTPLVLKDTKYNKYYAMNVSVWGQSGSGGVTYTRQEIDVNTGALIGDVVTFNQATSGDGTVDRVSPSLVITRPAGGGGLINLAAAEDGGRYKAESGYISEYANDIVTTNPNTGECSIESTPVGFDGYQVGFFGDSPAGDQAVAHITNRFVDGLYLYVEYGRTAQVDLKKPRAILLQNTDADIILETETSLGNAQLGEYIYLSRNDQVKVKLANGLSDAVTLRSQASISETDTNLLPLNSFAYDTASNQLKFVAEDVSSAVGGSKLPDTKGLATVKLYDGKERPEPSYNTAGTSPDFVVAADFRKELQVIDSFIPDSGDNHFEPIINSSGTVAVYVGFDYTGGTGGHAVAKIDLITRTVTDITPTFTQTVKLMIHGYDAVNEYLTVVFFNDDTNATGAIISYLVVDMSDGSVIKSGETAALVSTDTTPTNLKVPTYAATLDEIIILPKPSGTGVLRIDCTDSSFVSHTVTALNSLMDLTINLTEFPTKTTYFRESDGLLVDTSLNHLSSSQGDIAIDMVFWYVYGDKNTTPLRVFTHNLAPDDVVDGLENFEYYNAWYGPLIVGGGGYLEQPQLNFFHYENGDYYFHYSALVVGGDTFVKGEAVAVVKVTPVLSPTSFNVEIIPIFNYGLIPSTGFDLRSASISDGKFYCVLNTGPSLAELIHPGMEFSRTFSTAGIPEVKRRLYVDFVNAYNAGIGDSIVGSSLVMHDTYEDRYYQMDVTVWGSGGSGGVTYTRQELNLAGALIGDVVTFNQATSGDGTVDVVSPGLAITRPAGGGGLINAFRQSNASIQKLWETKSYAFDMYCSDLSTGLIESIERGVLGTSIARSNVPSSRFATFSTQLNLILNAKRYGYSGAGSNVVNYNTVDSQLDVFLDSAIGGTYAAPGSAVFEAEHTQAIHLKRKNDRVQLASIVIGATADLATRDFVVGEMAFDTDTQKLQVYVADTGLAGGGASNSTPGLHDMY